MQRPSVLFAAVALAWSCCSPALSQDAKKSDPLKGVAKSVSTKDGWEIAFTYYESPREKDAAVVVLVHGKNDNRVKWTPLAQELAKQDYAVISVDLRKHGESKPTEAAGAKAKSTALTKFDYEAMIAQDLEAIKKFIYEEHQEKRLNMRKMAIVAADMSTALTISYAALDWTKAPYDDAPTLAGKTPRGQDVQAIVLLSPTDSLTGINVSKAAQVLRPMGIAVMLLYSAKTATDKQAAERIFQQLGGARQDEDNPRLASLGVESPRRGIDLLGQPVKIGAAVGNTNALIAGFLSKHVRDQNVEWRDRKSRLE